MQAIYTACITAVSIAMPCPHRTATTSDRDQLVGVDASEPFHAGPGDLGLLKAPSGALEGEGWQVDLVQAACSEAGRGVTQQHLASCWQV